MNTSYDTLLEVESSAEGITWPKVTFGPAATLTALLHYLDQSQWLPRERIAEMQFTQLALLAAYAETHSPYFRQALQNADLSVQDIASPEGFARLPLLTRRDVQQAAENLYCREVPPAHFPCKIFRTSGSTGEPVIVRKTTPTNLFWQANTMREHFWHHRDFSGKVMVIQSLDHTQYIDQPGWGPPLHLLFPSGAVRSIPIAIDIKEQIQEILAFKPQHLLAYPNNINALITECQKQNIIISCIRHIWCSAETLTPELRQKAAAFFGASIEDNYSSEEMGIMALQCPHSGLYHVMAESIILEVLRDDGTPCIEGQTGKVVATDLHNFATPLIRYVTGDYAEMGGDCPCGRGLPVLKAIRGRERNLIAKPGGVRHWPRIDFAGFKYASLIRQHQIIQHSLDEIEIRLVTESGLRREQEAELIAHLTQTMGAPFHFRFTYFKEKLPLSVSGKFEEFICRI